MEKRYWSKFPNQSFESSRPKSGYRKTMEKKIQDIERGYVWSNHPYVQLVEETKEGYAVIAEWMPNKKCWISFAEAEGLISHPVR